MLPIDYVNPFSMTGLLLLLEVTVCLTLCFYNCLLLGLKYARAKPPPVPWIYGRPYQFRGRTYTYERPRKRRFFSPHSGTTLQDLLRAEHHQRMRAIMRARGLLRESYRVRHKRRHKKRHHRARPRLFPGKTRGRQARTLEDKSIKLRHFSSHWTGSRLQRREDPRWKQEYWFHPSRYFPAGLIRRIMSRGVWNKSLSRETLRQGGVFAAWNKVEDGNSLLFALSAPNGLLQPLRQTARSSTAGRSTEEFPIIWDTGASRSVSPNKQDFKGKIRPSATRSLTGLANGLEVCGEGEVQWTVLSDDGQAFTLEHTAYYVPESPCRLLSCQTFTEYTQALYGKAYEFVLRAHDPRRKYMKLQPSTEPGIPPQPKLPTITCMLDERTNLPISIASSKPTKPGCGIHLCVTDDENQNLSQAQKELLRWHFRLGHLGFRTIQMLLRSKALGESNLKRAAAKCPLPKCASCQYGKQKRRPTGATVTTPVPEREGSIKAGDLQPGQQVSVDHFYATHKGRLYESFGRSKADKMYMGGCIFVDHASGYIHVEHQVGLNSHETLKAKRAYEKECYEMGVGVQSYQSDNGTFASREYEEDLKNLRQHQRFAGVGAHHQNGVAERSIQTIMSMARTMMIHAHIRWPDVQDLSLWPMAVHYATYIYNHTPNPSTGIAPIDIMTRTRMPRHQLADLHTWGCPTYVLEPDLHDGKKIPRWQPRSRRGVFLGFSPSHSSTVPIVLHNRTLHISPQFHVVFDDWFSTVIASDAEFPDDPPPGWYDLFRDSRYQYVFDEETSMNLTDEWLTPAEITEKRAREHASQIRAQQERRIAQQVTDASAVPQREEEPRGVGESPAKPSALIPVGVPPPAATPASTTDPPRVSWGSQAPQRELFPSIRSPQREPAPREPAHREPAPPAPSSLRPSAPPSAPAPSPEPSASRRSGRHTTAPVRYPRREPGFMAHFNLLHATHAATSSAPSVQFKETNQPNQDASIYLASLVPSDAVDDSSPHKCEYLGLELNAAFLASKKKSDPDSLMFHEAMADVDKKLWLEGMNSEIQQLESMDCWDVIPRSQATKRVVPSTWACRRKRYPDGRVKKCRSRFCVRGDLEDDMDPWETYAPVVSSSTVRLVLIMCMVFGLTTWCMDFTNAFVHAELKKEDYYFIELPKGYETEDGSDSVLMLKRALYGSRKSPKLFFNALKESYLRRGFTQSKQDPCLFFRHDMMILCYVDDQIVCCRNPSNAQKLMKELSSEFTLTDEGTLADYLGIHFEVKSDGSFEATQTGLVDKIIAAAGLLDSNPCDMPTALLPIGRDAEGKGYSEEWHYNSIIGMLQYLQQHTRPDITYAVNQCARFAHDPKESHAKAVKKIIRYLKGTREKGLIYRPTGELALDCYCDADFCGQFPVEDPNHPVSVKSRSGYVFTMSGCPFHWASKLQTLTALSSTESETLCLSEAMRHLLPLRELVDEVRANLGLDKDYPVRMKSKVFEDNNGCISLATSPKITPRSKHIGTAHFFFKERIQDGSIEVLKIDTTMQKADIFTKAMTGPTFKTIRRLLMGW